MAKKEDDGSVKTATGYVRPLAVASIFLASWMYAMKPPSASSLDSLKLLRVLDLKGATHHVQGIDTDAKRLWVTSVDTPNRKGYLHEFSMTAGESLRVVEIQDGERFHPGGISSDAKSLWVPVAEYRANSTSVIQRRNKRTLQLELQFAVPDHIGCLAVTPRFLIGGNWDSRDFYIWSQRGELIRKVASPTSNAYQDMKFDSKYLVASGVLAGGAGAIDWLDAGTMQVVHRLTAGRTDRGDLYTREGMAVRGDRLFLLPEDSPSRLFVFSRLSWLSKRLSP
jgi:hypothetical protein